MVSETNFCQSLKKSIIFFLAPVIFVKFEDKNWIKTLAVGAGVEHFIKIISTFALLSPNLVLLSIHNKFRMYLCSNGVMITSKKKINTDKNRTCIDIDWL
jgi:hypothetical protein